MCIDEGKITQLICPEQKCSANLSDIFLQSALTEDLFERLEDGNFCQVTIFINLATCLHGQKILAIQYYSNVYFYFHFRYIELKDKANLDAVPGVVFCPRPQCASRIFSDVDSNLVQCDSCGFPFCKLCNQTWHGPGLCPTIEKVQIINFFQLCEIFFLSHFS